MLAYASGGRGQRIVENDGEERLFQISFLVELQEARDVHVQRAAVFAGRQRQLLADASGAAAGEDVVLELAAEMAQRGQHRIGRRLAQAAQRAVTNVAAQFVEKLQ